MSILAYITDLFFQAQISQAAQAAAVEVKVVSSLYHFLPGLNEPPSLVLIDLDAKGISPTTLIAQVKEKIAHSRIFPINDADGIAIINKISRKQVIMTRFNLSSGL